MSTIVKDIRVGKAVLRRMATEHNFDAENVYMNPKFKYIQTIDRDKKDADFCQVEYKGSVYQVRYFDGSFYPYLLKY
jgi:hypothetical protein